MMGAMLIIIQDRSRKEMGKIQQKVDFQDLYLLETIKLLGKEQKNQKYKTSFPPALKHCYQYVQSVIECYKVFMRVSGLIGADRADH